MAKTVDELGNWAEAFLARLRAEKNGAGGLNLTSHQHLLWEGLELAGELAVTLRDARKPNYDLVVEDPPKKTT